MRESKHCCRVKVFTQTAINVPMSLLQESKSDPLEWSLVALSVAMKCYSPSSAYFFRSEHQFRHDFHVRHDKARRMLVAIRGGHPLFRVERLADGRELITARSFKKLCGTWFTDRKGRPSIEMTVAKVDYRKRDDARVTLIEREMRQLLFLRDISARTRADELQSKGRPLTGSTTHAAKTTLSVPYLGRAVGRSPRTVVRMSRAARLGGIIRVTQYPLVRCCDNVLHAVPGSCPPFTVVIGLFGFTRRCNDYALLRRDLQHRFQHIIYGHRRRMTFNVYLTAGESISQTDLHALYD